MKKKKKEEFKIPVVPDQRQLLATSKPLLALADSFKITTEEHFVAGWGIVERLDQAIARVGESFNPFVQGLYKMHKMAVKLRAQFLDPLEAAKRFVLEERQRYREEQEELKRREPERAARALQQQQKKELLREAKHLNAIARNTRRGATASCSLIPDLRYHSSHAFELSTFNCKL